MKSLISVSLTLLLLLAFALPATAATEHCPDHDSHPGKVQGQNNSLILDEGTEFCVKASNQATSVLTADGVTSLIEYVEQAGIVNNKGKPHDVSYYVDYSTPQPEPSPDPSPTPDPDPSPTPDPTEPPETPSPEPTPEPTEPTEEPEPEPTTPDVSESPPVEVERSEPPQELPVTGLPISSSTVALILILSTLAIAGGYRMLQVANRNG